MMKKCDFEKAPTFSDWGKAERWLESGLSQAKDFSVESLSNFVFLEWKDLQESSDSPFGFYSSENWQRWVFTVFLADLVSYPVLSDQVNFERLLFVMHRFPQGFRVWFVRGTDGNYWPAGYSGWYPISDSSFESLEKCPQYFLDRLVVPIEDSYEKDSYLYLFNYSVHSSLKRTALTKQLLLKYSQEIVSRPHKGLCAITVSEEGSRVANRFGMVCTGDISHDSIVEKIYTLRK